MHADNLIQHQRTDRCNRAMDMRLQIGDVELDQRSGEMKFSLYDRYYDPLVEGVK